MCKLQTAIENQRKELVSRPRRNGGIGSAVFQALLAYCDNDEDRAQALLRTI